MVQNGSPSFLSSSNCFSLFVGCLWKNFDWNNSKATTKLVISTHAVLGTIASPVTATYRLALKTSLHCASLNMSCSRHNIPITHKSSTLVFSLQIILETSPWSMDSVLLLLEMRVVHTICPSQNQVDAYVMSQGLLVTANWLLDSSLSFFPKINKLAVFNYQGHSVFLPFLFQR